MATFFRKDGWIKTVLGPAVAGAQVYVCAPQPANVSALPPSPLANIFSDINGLVPIVQPIESDGFGHYNYYVAAGLYTEVVAAAGVIQQVYPDQAFGLGNAGPGNPYVAGANITIIGNVISAVIPPAAGVELQTNGVDNTLQTKLNLKNGVNITLTPDGAGGVTITNSQTSTPPTATIRFSVPKWENLGSLWAESPSLPWSIITGGIGAGQTQTFVQATASVAPYSKTSCTATATFATFFSGSSNSTFIGLVKSFKTNVAVFSATSQRYWIGLTDNVSAGTGGLEFNNPASNIVGFRFSTSVADTHWVAYCSTDGTHFTATDTGISVDITGALHTFEIRTVQGTPGTVVFYIDGTQVASISSNVPAPTTALTALAYSESLVTASGVPAIGCNLFYEEFFQ